MDRLKFYNNLRIKSESDPLKDNRFDEYMVLYDIVNDRSVLSCTYIQGDHCNFILEYRNEEIAQAKADNINNYKYFKRFGDIFNIQADVIDRTVNVCIVRDMH